VAAREREPGWLPDGRVAFSSERDGDRDFYAVRIEGEGSIQNLGESVGDASPDGRFVVMTECPWQGDCDLVLRRRDGSFVRRLAPSPAEEREPQFSPDGRKIAFTSNRGEAARNPFLVYVVDRRGGSPRLVSRSQYEEEQSGPTFSPNGRSLLFSEYGTLVLANLATRERSYFPRDGTPGSAYEPDWQSLPTTGEAAR
jgi:Tol biopolymer transport system component